MTKVAEPAAEHAGRGQAAPEMAAYFDAQGITAISCDAAPAGRRFAA